MINEVSGSVNLKNRDEHAQNYNLFVDVKINLFLKYEECSECLKMLNCFIVLYNLHISYNIPITPQAIRAPEFPVVKLPSLFPKPKSSSSSCKTSVRPIIEL